MSRDDAASYDAESLNSAWDELVLGGESGHGRRDGDQEWSETMRAVQHHAGAIAGPDIQFGRSLRAQLLGVPSGDAPVRVAVPTAVPVAKKVRLPRRRHERAWRGWVELAAVAAILLTLFGGLGLPGSESNPEPRRAIAPFVATPTLATAGSAVFRGTPGRTGQYVSDGLPDALAPIWDHEAPFAEFTAGQLNPGAIGGSGAIVAADEQLYLSVGGDVQVLDAATGEMIWSQEAIRLGSNTWVNPIAGPAVADGLVVYASKARGGSTVAVAALDAVTGAQRWSQLVQMEETSVLGWNISSPLIADGRVYVVVNDGESAALPAYADGRIFTGSGSPSSQLIAFDLRTGDELWSVAAPRLGAYDAGDGQEIWTSPSQATSLAVADGRLHVVVGVGEGKGIMTFDAATGDQLWRINNPDPTILPLAIADDMLIAVGTDQRGPSPLAGFARLRIIDAASGEEQRVVELGQVVFDAISAPSVAAGEVYVLAAGAGIGATVLRVPLDEGGVTYLALPLDAYGLVDLSVAGDLLVARGDRVVAYSGTTTDAAEARQTFNPLPEPLSCDVEARRGEAPSGAVENGPVSTGGVDRGQRGPTAGALTGTVSLEDERGVRTAVSRIIACQAVGTSGQFRALFSDDFFERGSQNVWLDSVHTTLDVIEIGAFTDGRIGAIVEDAGGGATLLVFVEQDNQWLIDDMVQT